MPARLLAFSKRLTERRKSHHLSIWSGMGHGAGVGGAGGDNGGGSDGGGGRDGGGGGGGWSIN